MNDDLGLITVNEKKEYHNCEMTFCCYYKSNTSDFKIEKDQKYKIYTTIEEVEVLNEALHVYQADGFKEAFVLFSAEVDGSIKYPEFVAGFDKVTQLGKRLQKLANDEDGLVQLQEYCDDQAPTYVDDFGINKQIESITIDGKTRDVNGYEDIKNYIAELKK